MEVKARRGDVNNWFSDHARNKDYFDMCDINELRDTRLKLQNKKFKIAIPPYKLSVNNSVVKDKQRAAVNRQKI